MLFNDVDIFTCKFFTLTQDKRLKFQKGKHAGKTSDDFSTMNELHEVTGYCFWVIKKADVPLVSKYLASVFLAELSKKKFFELEKKLLVKLMDYQERKKQETEESVYETGMKYGRESDV